MRKQDKIVGALLRKMEVERRLLGMPYLTWWFEYQRLEMFQPIEATFPGWMWSELAAFVDTADDVLLDTFNDYNRVVTRLQDSCTALQTALERSHRLHQLYCDTRETDEFRSLAISQEEVFGARWPEHVFSYISQLIVNKTPGDCSPLYTIRPYWQVFGEKYLQLRSSDEFRELSERSDDAADETAIVIDKLTSQLMTSS